jgi:hypothetical protein
MYQRRMNHTASRLWDVVHGDLHEIGPDGILNTGKYFCSLPADIPIEYPPLIRSTDYPLCSLWRYSNRPSSRFLSVCRYYNVLSYVVYSALSAITTTDCPLYSETATASFRSETERLSAQLCLAMLQPTICCASLLPL